MRLPASSKPDFGGNGEYMPVFGREHSPFNCSLKIVNH